MGTGAGIPVLELAVDRAVVVENVHPVAGVQVVLRDLVDPVHSGSVVHADYMGGKRLDHRQVVGDHHDCETLAQRLQQGVDCRDPGGVQVCARFVQKEELRFGCERLGDEDPLALAAGKRGKWL